MQQLDGYLVSQVRIDLRGQKERLGAVVDLDRSPLNNDDVVLCFVTFFTMHGVGASYGSISLRFSALV